MNRKFLLIAGLLLQIYSSSAQPKAADLLAQKFQEYLQGNFQEKIYIHSDKQAYLAGEIIWLKIYNTEAYTNRPSALSKVAYVELLNAQNKPVQQIKVELKDGKGAGSIYLPIAITSGSYTLRSYTNWMKNFDPSFYFHKELSIYNTVKEEDSVENVIAKQAAIQFFPEGGNLVSGLTSKVAFKAVDGEGKGMDFYGAIVRNEDTLVRFKPFKYGIGNFIFRPEAGQVYRVVIRPSVGKTFSAVLPEVFDKGVVMIINQLTSDTLNVNVQTKGVSADEKFKLFIHSGQQIVFTHTLSAMQISQGLKLPLSQLGDGISHVTLFNSANQPLCERLVFKKPTNLLDLSLSANKQKYSAREEVAVSVKQTNRSQPVEGNFSAAVYKAGLSDYNDEDIASNLWLTSELKGKVENPAWYLQNPYDEATDNLMLTHGWRRFSWSNIFQNHKQALKYLPEVQGHIITGRIVHPGTEKAILDQTAFLSIPDTRLQFYTGTSNQNGVVNFYTNQFYGASEIIGQIDPRKDSLARMEIRDPFSDDFVDFAITRPFTLPQDSKELLKRSVAMQVNNIYHSEHLNKESAHPLDSSRFYMLPDKLYKLDDFVRFTTMEEVLREYVTEVAVAIRRKSYQLRMFNTAINEYHDKAPLILLDGVPIFDEGDGIIGIDPANVKRLELSLHEYVYGHNHFAGISSFHTYKGNMGGLILPKQAMVMDYEGLQNQREFYSPMYRGDTQVNSRLPDHRTTLFWSSDNQTDSNGEALLKFFTSDLYGKYYVVVQSLSDNGNAGSQIIEFQVSGHNN